ncbi:transmembrane protease serine 9-like [Plodia interpunctella]|uniref:transmembrane protease serine 9-like n=1 Tax=Plodia interpunctella TaxID=58824 RepID=UPI002368A5AF|nr:transmembrane protease serine 9-like [Plodia interpunctella]
MWKCPLILVLVVATFSQGDEVRDARGVFTKNFFGGVWGNRPPLMELNQPKTTCTCKCGERNEASRIVGGFEAGNNEFPWMARLTYFKRFYCGGMLINDRYVLTAAHCVKGFMWFMIKVTFGEHNRCNSTTRPETRFALRAIANKFTLSNFDNDIALLRLNERVPISDAIKPICLPSNNQELYVGVKALAAGWGTLTEEGKPSCTLQEVEVPVMSNQQCRSTKYTNNMITDNMLCAGYPDTGKKDSCQGDSGGPLIAERKFDTRYELIGVVSWGNGCARPGYPGVYTRVTNYLDWIKENTKDACYCNEFLYVPIGLANNDRLQISQGSIRSPPHIDYFAERQRPNCQNCGCGERNEELRIVGGLDSEVNAFPWLARLIYHKSFGCGASLINDKYVVSAAHCVIGFMWFMFRVTLGEHSRCDTSTRPETRYVVKVIAHEFSLKTLMNDISLLRLNEPVTYSHAVRPVCLPKSSFKDYVGTTAVVAGWGATAETGKWSCTLMEAELPVLSNNDCKHNTNYNESKIQDVMMCAGFPATAHKDACTGDSGGPLVTENENHSYDLIGVVSWGYGCARKGYPGVYTRVTMYLDWIRENTFDGCYCKY